MGVKFNPEKAGDLRLSLRLDFTDSGETHVLETLNGVLHNRHGRAEGRHDVTLKLDEAAFFALLTESRTLEELIGTGAVRAEGAPDLLARLFAALDDFDPNFPIVTP